MFEHVIRNPFDMKPVFNICENPKFNANETDLEIQNQKLIELNNLGDNIWFETEVAQKEKLVEKTAASLGLFNQHDDYQLFTECDDVKQLGMVIEDDVVIMHNGKLEACFVAFPSSWNAGEKVGKSLNELHEPIADNEALLRASDGIWARDTVIRISLDEQTTDPFELSGKFAKIYSHKTTGSVTYQVTQDVTVTDVRKLAYITPPIYELTIERRDTNTILIPGAAATATANRVGTTIGSITVDSGGSGYYAAPAVNILSPTGSGATARAVLNSTGQISSIVVTNAGSGYSTGIGTLAATVATSGTAGQFTCGASTLAVGDRLIITGTRAGTGTITGYTSGTIYKVSAVTGSVGAVTGFTLTTQSGAAIVTTAGTLTGLTYVTETVTPTVVFDNTNIRTRIELATDNTTIYGYIIRVLNSVSIGTGTLESGETDYGFQPNQIYQIDEAGAVGPYAVSSYFAGDYVASGLDNNASIKIDTIDEDGLPTAISIFYSGYAFEREIFDFTIVSPNGGSVDLTFTTGAEYTRPGRFKDSRGMLSNVNKLQDNYYYQNYSYVIRSGIPQNRWINVVKNTVHPAGMAVFGELNISQIVDYSPNIGILEEKLHLYEFVTDSITISDSGMSAFAVTFVKVLTDSISTPTDVKTIAFGKNVTDATGTSTDVNTITIGKNVSDSATSSDAVNSITFSKVLADSVTVIESLIIGQVRDFEDSTSTATDDDVISFGKNVSDSISSPTDDDVISFGKNVSDSISTPTDAFDSFVVGEANKIARAAAMQVSINPGKLHNPLFIYGGSSGFSFAGKPLNVGDSSINNAFVIQKQSLTGKKIVGISLKESEARAGKAKSFQDVLTRKDAYKTAPTLASDLRAHISILYHTEEFLKKPNEKLYYLSEVARRLSKIEPQKQTKESIDLFKIIIGVFGLISGVFGIFILNSYYKYILLIFSLWYLPHHSTTPSNNNNVLGLGKKIYRFQFLLIDFRL